MASPTLEIAVVVDRPPPPPPATWCSGRWCCRRSLPTPPNGGYGWVVVAGSFLCHLAALGTIYAFGVIYNALLKDEDLSDGDRSGTAWILSMAVAFCFGLGIVMGEGVARYGARVVTMVGGVLMGVGIGASSVAQGLPGLYVAFGVVAGTGFAFSFAPSLMVVNAYFTSRRALATGIAVAGSGVGTFVMNELLAALVAAVGWRDTLRITGAMVGGMVVLSGITLVPIASSGLAAPPPLPTPAPPPAAPSVVAQPPVADAAAAGTSAPPPPPAPSTDPVPVPVPAAALPVRKSVPGGGEPAASRAAVPATIELTVPSRPASASTVPPASNAAVAAVPATHASSSGTEGDGMQFLAAGASVGDADDSTLVDIPVHGDDASPMARPPRTGGDGARGGSGPSHSSSSAAAAPPPPRGGGMSWHALLHHRATLTMAVSMALYGGVLFVPFTHLVQYMEEELGYAHASASSVMSVIGAASTIGRVAYGRLTDCRSVSILVVYQVSMVVAGVAAALLPVWRASLATMYAFAVIFGLHAGAIISIGPPIVAQAVGVASLPRALGIVYTTEALPILLLPPLAGWHRDFSGSYYTTWLVTGVVMIASALVTFRLPLPPRR